MQFFAVFAFCGFPVFVFSRFYLPPPSDNQPSHRGRAFWLLEPDFGSPCRPMPSASPFDTPHWACHRLCLLQDPAVGPSTLVHAPSQLVLRDGNNPPTGATEEEEIMLFTGEEKRQDTTVVAPTSVPSPTHALQGKENAPATGAADATDTILSLIHI